MKALVVDDDPIVLRSCERVLGEEGFTVECVPNADVALDRLSESTYDILLVDVKMPGKDGLWLVGQVRRDRLGLPVVVMSGYSTRETIRDSLQVGARKFLAKPFTPDELASTVRNVLAKGEQK